VKKNHADGKKTDRCVYFCESCRKCWEYLRYFSNNNKYKKGNSSLVIHLTDFPTYGKKRKICKDCKKDAIKNFNSEIKKGENHVHISNC